MIRFLATVFSCALILALSEAAWATETVTGNPVQAPISSAYFGLHIHAPNGSGQINQPVIHYGYLRMWDTATNWALVNPKQGVFDWTNVDKYVNYAQANGINVIFTISRTPTWASSNPNLAECTTSKTNCCVGNAGGCVQPKNWAYLDSYVEALVTRYKGRIQAYEFWNEPHNSYSWQPVQNGVDAMPAFITLTEHIRNKIRSIDPSARLVTPSGSAAFMDKYWSYGSKRPSVFDYDVLGTHVYSGQTQKPEILVGTYRTYNKVVAKYPALAGKPLWTTEGSWGAVSPVASGSNAAFVARWLILNRAVGVSHFFWYQYDNGMAALFTNASGLLPTGQAYAQVTKWIEGASMTSQGCVYSGTDQFNAVYQCNYVRGSTYRALAVWNSSGTSSFAIPAGFKQYRDLSGTTHNITSSAIGIGKEPILLETGPAP